MFAVNGLYGHVQRNAMKSALLIAGFIGLVALFWLAWCLIVVAVSEWISPRHATADMPTGVAIANLLWLAIENAISRWWVPVLSSGVWFIVAWIWHKHLIRTATGARPVSRREAPRLYNFVENLSISAGLPMPRVEIMSSTSLNAYAAGLTPADSVVAVTQGLLDTLDDQELEAVIAHEITHIKNRDAQLMVVAAIFVGGLTSAGDLASRMLAGGSDHVSLPRASRRFGLRSGGKTDGRAVVAILIVIALAMVLLAATHLFALMARFAISRSREYMADAGAVELTKNPDSLISALMKISGHDQLEGLPATLQAMMISFDADHLFATHPPITERIDALQKHAGGKVVTRRPRMRPPGRTATSDIADGPLEAKAGFVGARPVFGRRV